MSQEPRAKDQAGAQHFQGDLATYVKEHILLAALGSVAAVGVLMAMGNPHAWTGVVGAVMAIGARGVYVASEQLGFVWTLTDNALVAPSGKEVPLRDIAAVRRIFSAVQVVTQSGDKFMIKYQPDPPATRAIIEAAI